MPGEVISDMRSVRDSLLAAVSEVIDQLPDGTDIDTLREAALGAIDGVIDGLRTGAAHSTTAYGERGRRVRRAVARAYSEVARKANDPHLRAFEKKTTAYYKERLAKLDGKK